MKNKAYIMIYFAKAHLWMYKTVQFMNRKDSHKCTTFCRACASCAVKVKDDLSGTKSSFHFCETIWRALFFSAAIPSFPCLGNSRHSCCHKIKRKSDICLICYVLQICILDANSMTNANSWFVHWRWKLWKLSEGI